jgi:hypothetical protein
MRSGRPSSSAPHAGCNTCSTSSRPRSASQKHAYGGPANIFGLFDFLPLSTRIGRSQTAFSSGGILSAAVEIVSRRWRSRDRDHAGRSPDILTSVPRGPPLCQKTPEIAAGQLHERRFLRTVVSLGCEKRLLAALAHRGQTCLYKWRLETLTADCARGSAAWLPLFVQA